MQLAGCIGTHLIRGRLSNCERSPATSTVLCFAPRPELVIWMISAMFCPEMNCFSDEWLSIGLCQLSPSMTQHPADFRVVQRWILYGKLATFYLQNTQSHRCKLFDNIRNLAVKQISQCKEQAVKIVTKRWHQLLPASISFTTTISQPLDFVRDYPCEPVPEN